MEFNFRKIVKLHLDELLLVECNYRRKRCTIRWIKQGEDNTKIFHAMTIERYRRNYIALLHDADGNEISDHQLMAGVLSNEYKGKMGQSESISMQEADGLETHTRPFEEKELNDVVKNMPVDRAPGSDGFNGLFLKKCWPIIKKDFYKLAADFHDETI
jgi:mannosylglycoprotein endo-beta-mannosidase